MNDQRRFVRPWLLSALVVVIIRLLHAADIDYDVTLQIQAGQHLVQGKGLAVYWPTADDIAKPLTLEELTQFAAGYSLYTAALTAAGVTDPGVLIKISGAIATLFGWWGWARLAYPYMAEGMRQHRLWQVAGLSIAVICPILFTARWGGTDILLWAIIPWALEFIIRRRDLMAGLVIGAGVFVRYATVFVAAYAVAIMVWQRQWRRLIPLTAGMLPMFIIQWYMNAGATTSAFSPGSVRISLDMFQAAGGRAMESLSSFARANHVLLFWVPGRFRLWTTPAYEPLFAAIAAVLLPAIVIVVARRWKSSGDLPVVAAGLLVVLPCFLLACVPFGTFNYLRPLRYFESLRPLAVFVAFFLAWRKQRLAQAYLLAFMVTTAVEVAFIAVPTAIGNPWRRALVGAELHPWPSFRLAYEFSASRDFVLRLMEADPRALVITNREQWFYADPAADRSRIMRWEPCYSLAATQISGPLRVFILETESTTDLRWPDRPEEHLTCWPELPVTLLKRFPEEGMRVLQADLSEHERLSIRRKTASVSINRAMLPSAQ
jgi:glycosyl transferase family 87